MSVVVGHSASNIKRIARILDDGFHFEVRCWDNSLDHENRIKDPELAEGNILLAVKRYLDEEGLSSSGW